MKKSVIKIEYSTSKLNAIDQYMEKKDTALEKELEETMDKIYEKYVPAAVREFIEYNASQQKSPQPKTQKKEEKDKPQETPIGRNM